jgi:hypothetical protein
MLIAKITNDAYRSTVYKRKRCSNSKGKEEVV